MGSYVLKCCYNLRMEEESGGSIHVRVGVHCTLSTIVAAQTPARITSARDTGSDPSCGWFGSGAQCTFSCEGEYTNVRTF